MRKFALAAVALFATVGLTLAAEGIFKSYKDKVLTVTVDGSDKTFKVDDKTAFKTVGKDGDKDVPNDKGIERLEKMESGGKASGKAKLDVTGDKTATEVKFFGGGKKKN
ncbi:hypothetical protein [Fimbriiglobus ruber]|uniref:Uncharacterized protein n=1 Tax=Fimbriiglobus ruber TaxID=1908690 RepID=A0A225DVR8_9BACT|nr:hypothetical protein [Fimbriiglobus ruber]OWK41726.1 hypothetical protein FRUB_03804 [Fimbriiglobus ruber]